MHQKAEHIHLRASEFDKAKLTRAAGVLNLTVSKFILWTAIPAAEEIIAEHSGSEHTLFRLDNEAWKEFNRLLDAPTNSNPELRKLLLTKAHWEN